MPVYSYFYVSADLHGSRYLYFAAAGWAMLIAWLLISASSSRFVQASAVVAVCALLAAALHANLEPWRIAAVIVNAMEKTIKPGNGSMASTNPWRTGIGTDLILEDGVPQSYRGVDIFINGYPEFVARRDRQHNEVH